MQQACCVHSSIVPAQFFSGSSVSVRRREDCLKLVQTLERAQQVVDELRAMPVEGVLLDTLMIS